MARARIAPSILSADFACLGDSIRRVEGVADLLHVDVMDGHFVPNLTIGPPVVRSVDRRTELYLDCHLMMTNPGDHLEAFREAGADGCSVHVEVGATAELVAAMRGLGLDVGLAVNPATPFEAYEQWITDVDMLLLMTVNPGFGGQSFMDEVVPKIRRTHEALRQCGAEDRVAIQVDGGIDERTAPVVAEAGASVFVAGSAVFGADDPAEAAASIRAAADRVLAGRP